MELKPGYKLTEVGVVPEDWRIQPLAKFAELVSSKRIFESDYVSTGIPFYRGGEISLLIENKSLSEEFFISEARYEAIVRRFGAPVKGDILITAVGTLGNIYLIPDNSKFYFKDGNLIWLRAVHGIDHKYLTIQLRNRKKDILDNAIGSTQKALTIITLKETSIPLPPTLAEQRAIAEALSDADALSESLAQLIAKKRAVKQGAMQELLRPKNGWVEKRLGELFDFSGGFSASRDQLSSEGYCYLHYGDIHASKKTFIDVETELQEIPKLDISLKRTSSSSLLRDGDVVFVDASEDEEGASRHIVVVNKGRIPFISGLHTIVAKSKTNELDNEYRRYCFQAAIIKEQFRFFAVGTKVSGISKTNIAKITITLPPTRAEQAAIAAVLSDMDTEVAALEAKLDKSRLVKQGMMQELLTGKTRLI